jgi:hypothetical protein
MLVFDADAMKLLCAVAARSSVGLSHGDTQVFVSG